jgi:hypothetical protein
MTHEEYIECRNYMTIVRGRLIDLIFYKRMKNNVIWVENDKIVSAILRRLNPERNSVLPKPEIQDLFLAGDRAIRNAEKTMPVDWCRGV